MNLTLNDLAGFWRSVWDRSMFGPWVRGPMYAPPPGPESGAPHYSGSWFIRAPGRMDDGAALRVATVWACVRLISEVVGYLPFILYRYKDGDSSNRERARTHPLYRVLHDQPNPWMSAYEFQQAMTARVALWGNAYAEVTRDSRGNVVSLLPLNSQRMRVERLKAGGLSYLYSDAAGNTIAYSDRSVFHLKGFGLDGYVGLPPLAFAQSAIGNMIDAEAYMSRFMDNDGKQPGVLMFDRQLKPGQREEIRQSHRNLTERVPEEGRLSIIEFQGKFEPIGIPPIDQQMLQTREFGVAEICRYFGVPEFLVFQTTKSTSWGSGIEQQNIAFLQYTLQPYLTAWEQATWVQLIDERDQPTHYAEHLTAALLRSDSQAKQAFYSSAAQNGYMTRNEIRRAENLPADPSPAADSLTIQVNLAPLEDIGEQPAQPTPSAQDQGNVRQIASVRR